MSEKQNPYLYWYAIDAEDVGRIGHYFSNTVPPHIGDEISLEYFVADSQQKEKFTENRLYKVVGVRHLPTVFEHSPYADAPSSAWSYVNIFVKPVIDRK